MKTVVLSLVVAAAALLGPLAVVKAVDASIVTANMASDAYSKGAMICAEGDVERRDADDGDGVLSQVFGVPQFVCRQWRMRDKPGFPDSPARRRRPAADKSTA